MKIENYIESKYRELFEYKNIEYENLYKGFTNVKLIEIFSTIHHLIIGNFKLMNSRLPTKQGTAHFWADNSRQLILAIESVKGLQRALVDSEYMFEIDEYYNQILDKTDNFLSESNGSIIPAHMEKIELYYTIPLFLPLNNLKKVSLYETQTIELKMIGEGSYAHVYKYKDPFYKKTFVVKRAKKELNEKELERFKIEYESMKKLNSPYIVEVYSYNEIKKEYYMEFMDFTLGDYINENNAKLSIEKKKNICRQVLRAFQYIHSKGYFHRDISPSNVLVKAYEDVDVIKISDFGLIKKTNSQLTSIQTEFKGSFNDPALITDGFQSYNILHETYALTRVVSFVLTGKTNLNNIQDNILKKFINKGLSSNKAERFQSVDELLQAITQL